MYSFSNNRIDHSSSLGERKGLMRDIMIRQKYYLSHDIVTRKVDRVLYFLYREVKGNTLPCHFS